MKNILITIAYTGTKFHGYQDQPGLRTVEGTIKEALEKVFHEKIKLYSAGRTDAGVHALGQLANFKCHCKIDLGNLPKVINYHLPEDVSVILAQEVDMDFHSRYRAKRKHYRYKIYNERNRNGLYANRMAHCGYPLDVERMKRALMKIQGEHNFAAFEGRDASPANPVRTIDKIEIRQEGSHIIADFYGMSFLKNQIRIIMGTAMEIGRGLKEEDALYKATLTGKREDLGHTADPSGLYLMEIEYL